MLDLKFLVSNPHEVKDNLARRGEEIDIDSIIELNQKRKDCLLYTSPSPRDRQKSRMPSSA